MDYGTGAAAPRNGGASGWYCCWLSIASLVMMIVFLSGTVGSISRAPARVTTIYSVCSGITGVAFGVRCFRRREEHRGVAGLGLILMLPALLGQLLAVGFWLDWINIEF
jgi:hypothetical protein